MTLKPRTRIALAAIAVLLAAVVAAPFLIPAETYLRRIEALASERLGDPVRIEAGAVHLLPQPRVRARGIVIGDPPIVRVDELEVVPDTGTLLDSDRVIRTIRLTGVSIASTAPERMRAWARPQEGPPAVRVESIEAGPVRYEGLSGIEIAVRATLDARSVLSRLRAESTDGKLALDVNAAEPGRVAVRFNAKEWTPPIEPRLHVASLSVEGTVGGADADLTAIVAHLHGGRIDARSAIDWRGTLGVRGTAQASGLDLATLLPALGRPPSLVGRLTGDARFGAKAATLGGLAEALRVEGAFEVANGVLRGVDIGAAARLLVRSSEKGGETPFDRLSASYAWSGGGYRLRNIVVASGLLAARGQVDVSSRQALSGRIEADVGSGVASLTVPLDVSGTLADPVLQPTRAALAGAAAGTALAGPVGTAIGVKAGRLFDRVFGSDPARK